MWKSRSRYEVKSHPQTSNRMYRRGSRLESQRQINQGLKMRNWTRFEFKCSLFNCFIVSVLTWVAQLHLLPSRVLPNMRCVNTKYIVKATRSNSNEIAQKPPVKQKKKVATAFRFEPQWPTKLFQRSLIRSQNTVQALVLNWRNIKHSSKSWCTQYIVGSSVICVKPEKNSLISDIYRKIIITLCFSCFYKNTPMPSERVWPSLPLSSHQPIAGLSTKQVPHQITWIDSDAVTHDLRTL